MPVGIYKARHQGSTAQVDGRRLLIDHGQEIFRSANRFNDAIANADRLSRCVDGIHGQHYTIEVNLMGGRRGGPRNNSHQDQYPTQHC